MKKHAIMKKMENNGNISSIVLKICGFLVHVQYCKVKIKNKLYNYWSCGKATHAICFIFGRALCNNHIVVKGGG